MTLRIVRFVALTVAVAAFGLLALPAVGAAQTVDATPTAAPQPHLPATVQDVNGDEVTVADVSRIVPLKCRLPGGGLGRPTAHRL